MGEQRHQFCILNIKPNIIYSKSNEMRNAYLSFALFLSLLTKGQSATDFTVTSCGGINHNLFSALDTGKIVLLTWVKPENTHADFATAAYNVIQEFQVTNPNKIELFICGDYQNSSCNVLSSWMADKSFSTCTSFSDSTIKITDYKLTGTPKMAIIAFSHHFVFDVQVNNLNDSLLRETIRSIIIGPISQKDTITNNFQSSIMPNPVSNNLTVKYKLAENENLLLEILNSEGKLLKSISNGSNQKGTNTMKIDTQTLSNGTYFLKVSNGKKEDKIKFIVVH